MTPTKRITKKRAKRSAGVPSDGDLQPLAPQKSKAEKRRAAFADAEIVNASQLDAESPRPAEPPARSAAVPPEALPPEESAAAGASAAREALDMAADAAEEAGADLDPAQRDRGPDPRTKGELREQLELAQQELNREEDKRSEAETAANRMMIGGALGITLRWLFAKRAAQRGAHWNLRDDELQLLVDAWTPAIEPYVERFAQFAPLVSAAYVTVGVIAQKTQLDPSHETEENGEDSRKAAVNSQPRTTA